MPEENEVVTAQTQPNSTSTRVGVDKVISRTTTTSSTFKGLSDNIGSRWIMEENLNIFQMEDNLNFCQMEEDLNFALGSLGSWLLVCDIVSTKLYEI